MKKLLLAVFSMISIISYSQTTGYLRYDTVKVMKQNGNSNLIIENATRSLTNSFLQNYSEGRTKFAYALDSVYIDGDSIRFRYGTTTLAVLAPGGDQTLQQTFNTEVGGSVLTKVDTISTNNTLKILGTTSSFAPLLQIVNSGTTGNGISVTSAGTNATVFSSNTKTSTGGGWAFYGQSVGSNATMDLFRDSSSTSTVLPIVNVYRNTSGTAANGIGSSIIFSSETTNGNLFISNQFQSIWKNATHASRESEVNIIGVDNATEEVFMNIQKDLVRINNNTDTLATLQDVRDGGGSGAVAEVSKDFTLSNDSLYNTNWVNVVDYGADPTGVSNSVTAFTNAIATGKTVFVPAGTFLLTGSSNTILLALNANQKIFGMGEASILKTTSDARIIAMQPFSVVDNLAFLGSSGKTISSNQYQTGIVASTNDTGWLIKDVVLRDFGGSDTYLGGAIYVASIVGGNTMGATMNNINIYNSRNGITLNSRAEYLNISSVKIVFSHVGVYNEAGNVQADGFTIQHCDTAYKMFGGTNNGHAVFSNSLINHNTYNLVVDGITNGQLFDGLMMYAGDVVVRNSTGIRFADCDFSTGDITLTNNTNLYRSGRWLNMTKSLVSGEDFNVLGETKTGAGAIPWIDQYSLIDTVRFRGPMFHNGVTPASASASDSVWVKDATTGQWKLRAQGAISGGGATFETLSDGPGSFTGQATKSVRVNAGETALEYYTPPSAVPGSYLITHTSGTTWTTPANITTSTRFKITMIGGGSGGSGMNTSNGKAPAGGGGGGLIVYVTGLTASTGYTMAIGAGGAGGDATPSVGGAGGNTTLTIGATTYTASGAAAPDIATNGGAGGTATNGDINITGQDGGSTAVTASGATYGSAGGSSPFGLGLGGAAARNGSAGAGNGKNATGYGAGGGGGVGTTATGGNGTQGIIIIEYIN